MHLNFCRMKFLEPYNLPRAATRIFTAFGTEKNPTLFNLSNKNLIGYNNMLCFNLQYQKFTS
jgi:hypothetical protein